MIALFAGSALLRRRDDNTPTGAAVGLSLLGGRLALGTGWLGGELVDRLRVGIDDVANTDSPSSLSGLPADAKAA